MEVTLTKFNVKLENCLELTREEYNELYENLLNIQTILGNWCEINVDGLNYKTE